MNARRTSVDIVYNGVNVTAQISPYVTDFTYTDPASGEADSLDISIHDREKLWMTDWFPAIKDKLSAVIHMIDSEAVGKKLDCGMFILDKFSFHGWPTAGTLSCVSVPADTGFRETKRTKNWEDVTIQEIGKEVAERAGVSLVWDVESEPFIINSIEQSEQTDCEFFMNLCDTYGLAIKVYSNKIVVYDREIYKEKDVAGIIAADDMITWSVSVTMPNTYTGGEYTYTDPLTEEEIKVTVGSSERSLKLSGKADSSADAERKLIAAVNIANHGSIKLSVTIMGNASYVASQCVEVADIGKLSGKYYIDSITHRIGGSGYEMDMDMSLVVDTISSGGNGSDIGNGGTVTNGGGTNAPKWSEKMFRGAAWEAL